MNIDVFGITIAVPGGRRGRRVLRQLFEPLVIDGDGDVGQVPVIEGPSSPAAVVQAVNRIAAGRPGPARLVLHAGVVELGGGCVLVPGRSFAGKSTFVAALCQLAGARYGGDELCALDVETGEIETYPKPLGLKPSGIERVAPWFAPGAGIESDGVWLVPPGAFRNGLARRRLRATAVVFPERCGCDTVEVLPLPPAEAAFRLCAGATNLAEPAAAGFRAACALARGVPVYRVSYGEAAAAVDALASVL